MLARCEIELRIDQGPTRVRDWADLWYSTKAIGAKPSSKIPTASRANIILPQVTADMAAIPMNSRDRRRRRVAITMRQHEAAVKATVQFLVPMTEEVEVDV